MAVSIVVPAYNEENGIGAVIEQIRSVLNASNIEHEIVVVVDGATDKTEEAARKVADQVIVHPANMGYGRALKSGILHAKNDTIGITDADGTYPVEMIPELLKHLDRNDMVVGARQGEFYQGGTIKRRGRVVFRLLSEYATGQSIPDINSGLRVFRRSQILPFFPLINSGFSFTTTSTLVYLLNDMFVRYIPVEYHKREGASKVRHLRDSLRALQIIFEAILRCNPIKAFLLLLAPFLFVGVLFFPWSFLFRSHWMYNTSLACFCTSGVLLGMGFLAVSLLPSRQVRTSGSLSILPPNGSNDETPSNGK